MMTRITHQQILWALFLAFGGVALMMVMSDPAFALGAPTTKNFSCAGGKATGELIAKATSCPTTLKWDNIFSFLVCHVEVITSQIFGNIYCGIIRELMPAVKAVVTLSVVFFGIGFTIGVIPATGREFISFLLKVAFIWAFATQADYMIGYGYNFFVAGLRDGTTIAMSSIMPNTPSGAPAQTAADMYGFLDRALLQIIGFAADNAGEDWGPGNNPCQNAIFAALLVMAAAFPPLFLLSIMLFAKMIMVFLRACFGYMFSIVGLAFLMILSPIFLSFALFKQTRSFFDKWLGYLASFTLQMVIIFAFIAMVISMNPSGLVGSLTQLVKPRQETIEASSWRWPWEYCTLCKFEVVTGGTPGPNGTVTGGTVKTLDPGVAINPATDRLRCLADGSTFGATEMNMPNLDTDQVNALFQLTVTTILSLMVLAYIVDQLLLYVPSIAWRLASAMSSGVYAPQMVASEYSQTANVTAGPLEMMSSAGTAFEDSFMGRTRDTTGRNMWNTDTVTAIGAGTEAAGRAMANSATESFINFFINPNRSNSND